MFNKLRMSIATWLYPDLLTALRLPKNCDQIDPGILDWLIRVSGFEEIKERNVKLARDEYYWHWKISDEIGFGEELHHLYLGCYITDVLKENTQIDENELLDMRRKQAKDAMIRSLSEELVI